MKDKRDLIDEMILCGYSDAEIAERLDDPDYLHEHFVEKKKKEKEAKKNNKHRIRFGKRFLACLLAGVTIGCGIGGFHLHRKHEIARVKNYLEDFLTEDNYVDLSKISRDYDIKDFDGQYLYEALKDSDIKYVRITSDYIVNEGYEGPIKQMTSMNKDVLLGYDDFSEPVYEGYEPIRRIVDGKVVYDIPEGYTLEEVNILTEPTSRENVYNSAVIVRENNYEESYSLSLEKKQ